MRATLLEEGRFFGRCNNSEKANTEPVCRIASESMEEMQVKASEWEQNKPRPAAVGSSSLAGPHQPRAPRYLEQCPFVESR